MPPSSDFATPVEPTCLIAPATPVDESETWAADIKRREPWNFSILSAYQVLMRTGWIFKTESIIMPAVLDSLGGSAWMRGCLPLLNRFGQSIPPLMLSRRIKITRRKKWALTICTTMMSVVFLLLSTIWLATGNASYGWMSPAFMALYALFFISTGVNQLSFSTLQGKLIGVTRRGRLLLVASLFGAATAILAAWKLLPLWLQVDGSNFAMIFGFTGVVFAMAAVVAAMASEPPDSFQEPRSSFPRLFQVAWITLRKDRNFARLAVVAALFNCSMMLFPHYQALGRAGQDSLDLSVLIGWVIVQNAGTALFSMLLGPIADWRGNRLVLRFLMPTICVAPLLSLILARWGTDSSGWFALVFLFVGLTPLGIKTLQNYTLELAKPADHPRYLSALNLCCAAPVLTSPLLGWSVDWWGFSVVFGGIAVLLIVGWLLTFTIHEPRHC